MKIEKFDNYTVLTDERTDVEAFISYLDRIVPEKFEHHNLVIDLLQYKDLSLPQLLKFLKLSTYHRSTKHSFVIVNDGIDVDDIPFELVVVPTVTEARDIIEMEDIERDLGF